MRLLRSTLVSLFCLSTLIACGGGIGGVSSSASGETGQVTVLIGDARLFGWDHVWITFAGVQFITHDGQEIDALDAPREVDLLSLKHFTERLVPEIDVPTGTIEQVRFIISDIRLEKVDDLGLAVATFHPFGFGNVNVSVDNAEVEVGKKLVIEFDFDLDRSIHTSADGSETTFRPVITSKTSNDGLTPRLMRVEGDVDSVVDDTAKVCDIRSASHDDDDDWSHDYEVCMLLKTNKDTAYFHEMNDGSPVVLMPGDHIVAYGLIDMESMEDTLIVAVIAVGDKFVRLDGEALTVVMNGAFDLTGDGHDDDEDSDSDSDSDDGDDADDDSDGIRHVVLADGAKVFDAEPKQVDADAIAVTNYLETEGFPPRMDGDPDVHAFIVLLNHEVVVVAGVPTPTTTVQLDQVVGQIILYGDMWVEVSTLDGGTPCVMYDDTTDIVEIKTDSQGSTVASLTTPLAAPTAAQGPRFIDARGLQGDFCLVASSIVIDSVPFE